MKNVILKSLTLTNFRGEKSRTTEFNPVSTTIMGGNGLGKSRHFDAFCWLLFGKDKEERKDFEVRTVVDGEPLHKVECSVTGALSVSGEVVILKRVFAERWVKPRGQVEEVLKGNETETFWNDVPVSVTEYQKRVSGIIPEAVFKMVANPLFFATQLKWQDQREQLFQLAGGVSDGDVAAKKPEFATFLSRVSGKSLADFKREILARKKRLKEELGQVQPRIDQTHKLTPEPSDFEALEKKVEELERQVAAIDKAIADRVEAVRQQGEAAQKKQAEVNALKQRRQQALFGAQAKAQEAAFAASAARRKVEQEVREASQEVERIKKEAGEYERKVELLKASVAARRKEVSALREAWASEIKKEYAGDDDCPACGQPLPESMKYKARKAFADSLQKKLDEIAEKGRAASDELSQREASVSELLGKIADGAAEAAALDKKLAGLTAQLAGVPAATEEKVNPDSLPEYVALSEQIALLEAAVGGDAPPADTAELQSRRRAATQQLDTVKSELQNRELIAQYSAEIRRLEALGKSLAQQIADVEREEFIMQQLSKARVEECDRRINGLFERVTFKLFDYTIDGNEVETCVPLVGGVPFGAANTAGQLNAGLDIINALTKFYGVRAPIFIDRRESVNELIPVESQIVNLAVSKDTELVVA
jgi:DNA repair exonuclease SbcCD ATPase subunit